MLSSLNQMTSINSFKNPSLQLDNKIEENKPNSFSSNDSTHESNPKSRKYIFEKDTNSYEVYLILYEDKIKIKVNKLPENIEEYFYETTISQEELKKSNKVFKLCNDIEDSFDYLNELIGDKQNKVIVNEENEKFILEKKIKLYFTLKIEVQKKFQNNEFSNNVQKNDLLNNDINNKNELIKNNNKEIMPENKIKNKNEEEKDIEMISPLNITNEKLLNENKNQLHNFLYNNKDENDILELPEDQEDDKNGMDQEKESTKKNLLNVSKLKSAPNLAEENSKSRSSLLNRKRTTNSDLSDVSFNSISNENDFNNNNSINNSKKSKTNLAKENIMKIFCDNSSVNSGESSEKFFIKIQKNLNLEKNKKKENNKLNNIDLIENQINNEFSSKNKNYLEENLLFGDEDSSEHINDDLDLLSNKSNKSPKITPLGEKINNNNEFNENNYKNCLKAVQNIQLKELNKDNNSNIINNNNFFNNNYNNIYLDNKNPLDIGLNSYYMKNSYLQQDSFNKQNKYNNKPDKKSYRIIHKNFIEYCTTEIPYLFQDEINNSNRTSFIVESNIIKDFSEFDFIINYLKKKFNKEIKNSIRIYQATADGPTAADFHRICDGNTNIVVLIKTKDGKKFGGYTSVGFSNFNRSYHDDTAFIFSIDKREIYPNIRGKNAIDSYYNYGPCFSGDSIKIFDNFLKIEGFVAKNSANFETNEDYQINSGKRTFEIEEIEVLEFIEMKNDYNI